jgi:hypothetical protein
MFKIAGGGMFQHSAMPVGALLLSLLTAMPCALAQTTSGGARTDAQSVRE